MRSIQIPKYNNPLVHTYVYKLTWKNQDTFDWSQDVHIIQVLLYLANYICNCKVGTGQFRYTPAYVYRFSRGVVNGDGSALKRACMHLAIPVCIGLFKKVIIVLISINSVSMTSCVTV